MCGLAGLLHLDGRAADDRDRAAVRAMCELLAYRGPDDQGVELVGAACLGSRRLAILDLSPAGHMPMPDPTRRWWLAYNGEIYDFQAARDELTRRGVAFRSHSDTEVLLQAWIAWGASCLDRFAGMFAFAMFDSATGELTLVRDRYGVKPLYWMEDGGRLLFASEIKALLSQCRAPRLDHQRLGEWWLYRNVDALAPETLIDGVRQLMPGQLLRVRDGQLAVEPWYDAVARVDEAEHRRLGELSAEQIVGEVERQLDESVRLRLVSDVPVGTLLSGGLDSSLITALAARHAPQLSAFHVSVVGHEDMDERRFAEVLTAHHRLPFIPLELTAASFRAHLAQVTWLEDLPLTHANSVAYHLIAKVARAHGTIVVLSGEGADELFGGYAWNYRRRMRLRRLEPWLRRLPAGLHDTAALLVYAHAGLPVTARRFRELLPPAIGVLDRFARADAAARCAEAYGFVRDPVARDVSGAMLADLGDFLAPLLRRLDRTTMGASIECREPFLDHRLVHTAINLPLEWKVGRRADKWVLKQIARRHLPDGLIWRKKMGFPLPLADYIAPLATPGFFAGGFCEDALRLGRRGTARLLEGWQRWTFGAFGLIALELWGRMFLMGEPVDAVNGRIAAVEPSSIPARPRATVRAAA